MRFTVTRPFRWGGLVRSPGQVLELSTMEAARLRASGVLGGPERAVRPPGERAVPPAPERTVKPPEETRKRTPRKKAAVQVEEDRQGHEPDPDSAPGD